MRKVILDLAVSLDGFIEGPNKEIDWCIMEEDMQFDEFLDSIDTIFYGRVSYDMWGEYQADETTPAAEKKIWDAVHQKQKYVFSKMPKISDRVVYINENIPQEVEKIKAQPGKDIWLYGGAGLIKSFIDTDMIDIYRLAIHPVVLGSGTPLFDKLEQRINLKLISTKNTGSGVILTEYAKKV